MSGEQSGSATLPSNALFAPSSYVYDSPPQPVSDAASYRRALHARSINPQVELQTDLVKLQRHHERRLVKSGAVSPDENSPNVRVQSSSRRAKGKGAFSFDIPATDKPRKVFRPRGNEEEFQFLWYRLYECERYRKYRHGYGGKDAKGQKVDRWPLSHEEAFFRGKLICCSCLRSLMICAAVIRWQPVARKQLVPWYRGGRPLPEGIKNQPLGRNELIALFINDWFGLVEKSECIDRKKVSSHLQVLKSYFKADPFGKHPATSSSGYSTDTRHSCVASRRCQVSRTSEEKRHTHAQGQAPSIRGTAISINLAISAATPSARSVCSDI